MHARVIAVKSLENLCEIILQQPRWWTKEKKTCSFLVGKRKKTCSFLVGKRKKNLLIFPYNMIEN